MANRTRLIKYEYIKMHRRGFFVLALLFCLLLSILYQKRQLRAYRFWYATDERKAIWEQGMEMEPEEAAEWASAETDWYHFLLVEKTSLHTGEDTRLFFENMKEGYSFQWQEEFDRRWQNMGDYTQDELTLKRYDNIYGFLSFQLEYVQEFEEWRDSLCQQIRTSKENPLVDTESFAYKSSQKRLQDLEKLAGIELALDYSISVETGTEAALPDMLLPALALMAAWLVIGPDKEAGMDRLLNCTANGRKELTAAKAAACLLNVLFAAVVLYGGNLLYTTLVCGDVGRLDMPLQSLREFRDCRYAISVGGYLFAYFAIKLAGTVLFTMLALVVCAVFDRKVWFFPVFGIVLWGEYWLSQKGIRWSLFSFWDTRQCFQSYQNLNIMGKPVDPLWGSLFFFLSVSALLGGIYMASCLRGTPSGTKRSIPLKAMPGKGERASLFLQESYKIYLLGGGGICIAALLIYASLLLLNEPVQGTTGVKSFYHYFIHDINGGSYCGYTEETAEKIQEWKVWFAEEDEEAVAIKDSYEAGEMSAVDYEDWRLARRAQQSQRLEPFLLILEQEVAVQKAQVRAEEKDSGRCGFVSLYLAEDLLEDDGKQVLLYLVLTAVLCLVLPVIYAQEAESGMEIFLRTAGYGKKRVKLCKQLHCFLYTTVVFVLIYMPYLIWQWRCLEPEGMEAYIQCIPGYEEIPVLFTLGQGLFLIMVIRYVITCFMAACMISLGEICKSRQIGGIAGSVLFLMPGILYLTGVDVSQYTMLGGYLLPVLWKKDGVNSFSGLVFVYAVVCVLLAARWAWKGVKAHGTGN